jgi:hypothetical protein
MKDDLMHDGELPHHCIDEEEEEGALTEGAEEEESAEDSQSQMKKFLKSAGTYHSCT